MNILVTDYIQPIVLHCEVMSLIAMGIISAIGTIINNIEQNDANNALMERQNQFNKQQAKEAREWSSLPNEMSRAEEAGVNPVAVAMQAGNAFGSSSTSQASASQSIPSVNKLDGVVNGFSNLFNSVTSGTYNWEQANTERARRQPYIDNMKASTENLKSSTNNLNLDAHYKNIVNEYERDMREWTINGMKADVELTYAQQNALYKEMEKADVEMEKIWQDICTSMAQEGLLDAESEKTMAETRLTYMRMDEVLATIENINANTNLTNEQATGVALDSGEKAIQLCLKKKYAQQYMNAYESQLKAIAANAKVSVRDANWFLFNKLFGKVSNQVHNMAGLGSADAALISTAAKLAAVP